MSVSLSKSQLKVASATAVIGLAISAPVFYWLQDRGILPGGQIAAIKLAWLACAILFWYLIPALLMLDARMTGTARRACTFLLANMLVRAVIELFMMYKFGNWHPWIGIGHDAFSVTIMLIMIWPHWQAADGLYRGYLMVATAMYVPEGFFAWYMLTYASAPGFTTYFVADDPAHRGIMLMTALCVALLLIYLVHFSRRWLHGQTDR